ncbi:hypothetical protein HMPREF1328_02025 [Enterococcus faecalis ERV103]|nr:hypothetical protein HMPREF1328_02025 [Enterococcus faecalis ERV103]
MEQTKVNPVIECFVSHGPINQLSFFYVLYEKKSLGQKSLWIFASRSKSDKRGNRTSSFGNKTKFSKDQRSIFGNSFLFLGVKHFCPDLFLNLKTNEQMDYSGKSTL